MQDVIGLPSDLLQSWPEIGDLEKIFSVRKVKKYSIFGIFGVKTDKNNDGIIMTKIEDADRKTFEFCWVEIRKAVIKQPSWGGSDITDYAIFDFVDRESQLSRGTISKLKKVFLDSEKQSFRPSSLNKLARFVADISEEISVPIESWRNLKSFVLERGPEEEKSNPADEKENLPERGTKRARISSFKNVLRAFMVVLVILLTSFFVREYQKYQTILAIEKEFDQLERFTKSFFSGYDFYFERAGWITDISRFYKSPYIEKYESGSMGGPLQVSLNETFFNRLISRPKPFTENERIAYEFANPVKGLYEQEKSAILISHLFLENWEKAAILDSEELNIWDWSFPFWGRKKLGELKESRIRLYMSSRVLRSVIKDNLLKKEYPIELLNDFQ